MKKMRFGFDDETGRKNDIEEEESEHERNRRNKSEQARLLRRQLTRLRTADAAEDEREESAGRRD